MLCTSDSAVAALRSAKAPWPSLMHIIVLCFALREILKGFVRPFDGDESDAAQHWPQGTTIGKLNTLQPKGRDPRQHYGGLNTAVQLPEHVALPTVLDVQRNFSTELLRIATRTVTGLRGSAQVLQSQQAQQALAQHRTELFFWSLECCECNL